MKKTVSKTFCAFILIGGISFIGCENDNSKDEFLDSEILLSDDDIGSSIDYYAGHPADPQLPENVIGATDDVLEATEPRELADIIAQGIDFALDEVDNEPRYLFALGRAAYVLGYYKKAEEWLSLAADNGSAASKAYLGYLEFYENEDILKAKTLLEEAEKGGFKTEHTKEVYEACNFDPKKMEFNRSDLISAFYNKDWNTLDVSQLRVIAYIGKVHNTLWGNDILWLAEEKTEILMELDPALSASLTGLLFGNNESDVLLSAAVQDARRLALLYKTNPIAFRRIYSGMAEYFKSH